MSEIIVRDICRYIDTSLTSFTMRTNLFVGEMPLSAPEGVYAVSSPSQEPDVYTGVIYQNVDFWAGYKSDETAYQRLQELFDFLDRKHHYDTDNYFVYLSHATGQIEDQDRDAESRKWLRLGVLFILRNKAIVS